MSTATATAEPRAKEGAATTAYKVPLYRALAEPRICARMATNSDADVWLQEIGSLAPSWVSVSRRIRGLAYYYPDKPMPEKFEVGGILIAAPAEAQGRQNHALGYSHLRREGEVYVAQGVELLRYRDGKPLLVPVENEWREADEYGLPTGTLSTEGDPEARFWNRIDLYIGAPVRVDEEGRRSVIADYPPSSLFNVADFSQVPGELRLAKRMRLLRGLIGVAVSDAKASDAPLKYLHGRVAEEKLDYFRRLIRSTKALGTKS